MNEPQKENLECTFLLFSQVHRLCHTSSTSASPKLKPLGPLLPLIDTNKLAVTRQYIYLVKYDSHRKKN